VAPSAPHASFAWMDMISLSMAAMVVFIMLHRLEALSKKPSRTSFSCGPLRCILFELTIVVPFCRHRCNRHSRTGDGLLVASLYTTFLVQS
jgi:hypothetical protein